MDRNKDLSVVLLSDLVRKDRCKIKARVLKEIKDASKEQRHVT